MTFARLAHLMLNIKHKKPECIGCGACCDIAPAYWAFDAQGLAQLHSVARSDEAFEYGMGFDGDLPALREAERSCPVNIIKIQEG